MTDLKQMTKAEIFAKYYPNYGVKFCSQQKKKEPSIEKMHYNQRSIIYSFFTVYELACWLCKLSKKERKGITTNLIIGSNSKIIVTADFLEERRRNDDSILRKLDFGYNTFQTIF